MFITLEIIVPLTILNIQVHRKKSFSRKLLRIDLIFPRLRTFFFRTLIPVILFPELDFKTEDFISTDIWDFLTKVFFM